MPDSYLILLPILSFDFQCVIVSSSKCSSKKTRGCVHDELALKLRLANYPFFCAMVYRESHLFSNQEHSSVYPCLMIKSRVCGHACFAEVELGRQAGRIDRMAGLQCFPERAVCGKGL